MNRLINIELHQNIMLHWCVVDGLQGYSDLCVEGRYWLIMSLHQYI